MRRAIFVLALFVLTPLFVFGEGIRLPVSFRAAFVQQVKNTKGKVIKYRGSIIFNAPSEIKWNYKSPTKKEVCSSGKKLVVIDHDLEQVSYYQIDKGFNLAKVLQQAKLYKGNTYTTNSAGTLYTIVLNAQGEVEQIAYKDNLDNVVNIIFKNITYRNSKIDSSRFVCARPKNYDTIY